jgi:hypothetical protein
MAKRRSRKRGKQSETTNMKTLIERIMTIKKERKNEDQKQAS